MTPDAIHALAGEPSTQFRGHCGVPKQASFRLRFMLLTVFLVRTCQIFSGKVKSFYLFLVKRLYLRGRV